MVLLANCCATFEMNFEIGTYQVKIIDESEYNPDWKDNSSAYEKKHFVESEFRLSTKFGIKIFENGIELNSALITAEGGASGLHETSQIIENNRILICCCDSVFCLEIPTLNLFWKTKVDFATAFEIYKVDDSYIIHGELEISRIDKNGQIIWNNSGGDIFTTPEGTNTFEITENYIKALDWNKNVYMWDFDGNEIV